MTEAVAVGTAGLRRLEHAGNARDLGRDEGFHGEHTSPASFQYKAGAPRAASTHSKNLQVSAPRFALPGELTQPSVVLASYGEKREPARPDGTAAQQAAQQANAAAGTVAGTASPQAATSKYTGEPISVNLKDVDLRTSSA